MPLVRDRNELGWGVTIETAAWGEGRAQERGPSEGGGGRRSPEEGERRRRRLGWRGWMGRLGAVSEKKNPKKKVNTIIIN